MNILTKKILELQPNNGLKNLSIPGCFILRTNHVKKSGAMVYEPSIIFITSGKKNLYLGEKKYEYGEGKFLLVSTTTPMVCETFVGDDNIFTGLHITINKTELYNLIQELKISQKTTKRECNLTPGILPLDLNEQINNSVLHLLNIGDDEVAGKVIGPSIIREIMFYALQSSQAQNFCKIILNNKNIGVLGNVVDEINKTYKDNISVKGLAKKVNMPITTFYRHFKEFTGFAPNQYIKNIRLNAARNLIISEGFSVKESAREVGYNSTSQFSREYKRYFGCTPVSEVV